MATLIGYPIYNSSVKFSAPLVSELKSFGSLVSSALALFGWVKSSDSGQVNWSTLTGPLTTVASQAPPVPQPVYEIWMMADTLQAINPVYMRVSYGTGLYGDSSARYTNVGNFFFVQIMIGSGSDGSGNLLNGSVMCNLSTLPTNFTGILVPDYQIAMFSGDTSRFQMNMWGGLATFSIERSHDSAGLDTAYYVTMLWGGFGYASYMPAANNYGLNNTNPSNPMPGFQQSLYPNAQGGPLSLELYGMTFHTNYVAAPYPYLIPAVPFYPAVGFMDNPLIGAICVKAATCPVGSIISENIYGVSHTYARVAYLNRWGEISTTGTNVLALRFD